MFDWAARDKMPKTVIKNTNAFFMCFLLSGSKVMQHHQVSNHKDVMIYI